MSQLNRPLTDEQVRDTMLRAAEGMTVKMTWREKESFDDEWTTWHGEYIKSVMHHEELFFVIVWFLDDAIDSSVLPSCRVDCSELELGGAIRARGSRVSEKFSTTMHMQRALESSKIVDLEARLGKLEAEVEAVNRRTYRLESSAMRSSELEPPTAQKRVRTEVADEIILLHTPSPQRAEVHTAGEGLGCDGCRTFSCVLFSSKEDRMCFTKELCSTEKDHREKLAKWITKHQLVLQPSCTGCHRLMNPKLSGVRSVLSFRCPLASCHKMQTPKHQPPGSWCAFLFFLVDFVATHENLPRAHERIPSVCRNTTREWESLLAEAATLFNADSVYEREVNSAAVWSNVQWDETFHAARTFQRGHRVRESGALTFHGGVEVIQLANGRKRVIDSIVAAAATKGRVSVAPLVLATAAPGATIATDGARAYMGLSACGFSHAVVNHRKEFVTKDGVHTNAVEGYWRLLKSTAKRWWDRQPADSKEVALNFQLAHFSANCGLKRIDVFCALLVLVRWRAALIAANPGGYTALVDAAADMLASFKPVDLEQQDDDNDDIAAISSPRVGVADDDDVPLAQLIPPPSIPCTPDNSS